MNAKRDANGIPVLIAALNTDGVTPILIQATPLTHRLNAANNNTGTDYGTINAQRDDNRIPVLIAVSSVDGITPVEVYADSDGNLLITES